jgi:hypothetical protein
MDEMTIELDVRRVELAEEAANWRQLTVNSDLTEVLAATLDELRTRHAAAAASLPKAIADHTAAVAACDAAQRRHNAVVGRLNRVAPFRLSPAMEFILDAEQKKYRAAQIVATQARETLAQLKWELERLGSDIAQTEGVLAPPRPQLMEAEKRPQPTPIEVDDIVMPPGSTSRAA